MNDKPEKPSSLLREWAIGFGIAYVALLLALLVAVGVKGNMFLAVFYLPIYWAVTVVMAAEHSLWSLLITNIAPFFILALIFRLITFSLRYRVAGYLTIIGLLGIYNFPMLMA